MKKLRGSIAAKVVAWILISVAGMGLLGSVAGAFLMEEEGIYELTQEEFTEEAFSTYSNRYSARVLDYLGTGDNEAYFADKNFRYGVVQAESLSEVKKMDLSADSAYVERNFNTNIAFEDMNVFECTFNDNTVIASYHPESLFGYYWIYNGSAVPNENAEHILFYVYDIQTGIFYCETTFGKYYPVKQICIAAAGEDLVNEKFFDIRKYYEYDTESCTYVPVNPEDMQDTSAGSLTSGTFFEPEECILYVCNDRFEVTEENYASYILGCSVLEQSQMTFLELSDTIFCEENWEYIFSGYSEDVSSSVADGYYISSLRRVDLSDAEQQITQTEYYRISAEDEIVYLKTENSLGNTYFVLSYVEEPLTGTENWKTGDLYVKSSYLTGLVYGMRYKIYWLIAACAVICFCSGAFLVYAAGHKKNTDEIAVRWINKIPLEINIGVIFILEYVIFIILAGIVRTIRDITYVFFIAAGIFLILCAGWALLALVLDFAVRVKLGAWWRNTIVYRILHFVYKVLCRVYQSVYKGIGKIYRYFQKNTNLFWKLVLGFILLSGAELISFCFIYYGRYKIMLAGMFLWIAVKAVTFVFLLKCVGQMLRLKEAGEHIAVGDLTYQADTSDMMFDFKKHGDNLNSVNAGLSKAVDAKIKSERFKTELITNVSHDIKTPLTSIINYVDLLEKEQIENETALEYIEVLDRQSNRLKKLIEDLMEVSKASTGNLEVNFEKLEAGVFMVQTVGEFKEKTEKLNLDLIIQKPEEAVHIMADGRHFWRVIDNLMNNICKYAQPGTRVYINLEVREQKVLITFRNTSKYPLNISSEELMERFVRGDSSRNTEGSGLGLSIARSLMELMHGQFELVVDGDLFKVILTFAIC